MDMRIFAQRLKACREERNISAIELAEALGMNKATIYRYETAEIGRIKQTTINAIADYLGVSPDYLIGATDDKRPVKEAVEPLADITDGEQMLLELFRQVPADRQQLVIDLIRFALTRDR
ncbi:MAG: helix-turn-helix transcriptional regulator [Bacteroidaceae bacterium]|nr:helix-turn-helix transcriptional regulator [Bacteroidaceae bacterium]